MDPNLETEKKFYFIALLALQVLTALLRGRYYYLPFTVDKIRFILHLGKQTRKQKFWVRPTTIVFLSPVYLAVSWGGSTSPQKGDMMATWSMRGKQVTGTISKLGTQKYTSSLWGHHPTKGECIILPEVMMYQDWGHTPSKWYRTDSSVWTSPLCYPDSAWDSISLTPLKKPLSLMSFPTITFSFISH